MADERTTDSPDPLNDRKDVKDDTVKSQLCQLRITHATTVIVAIIRYTTIYTLKIRQVRDDSILTTSTVYRRIFDFFKKIDHITVIIFLNQLRISQSKYIPTENVYKNIFKDCCIYEINKRVYVSFKLELTNTVSQLKYCSYLNEYKYSFNTLHEISVFLKMNKLKYHTDVSIDFFLGIIPKFTLRQVLKEKSTKSTHC